MAQAKSAVNVEKSFAAGILEALSDKHSQIDINLQGMSVKLPNFGVSVECNGLVTLSCHIRDLTEDEKKAAAVKNVALMTRG